MTEHKKEANTAIEKAVDDFQETVLKDLKKNINKRVIASAAVVVAIAVVTFIIFLLYSIRDVNEQVIELQKNIIYAQQVIRDSVSEINDSKRLLTETKAQLDAARTDLAETKKTYEMRLGTLTKQKDSVYELKWSNVTTKNQPPDSDIAIDTSHANKLSISVKPLNNTTHKSKNYSLEILESAVKEGPYSHFYEMSNIKEYRSQSITPPSGFMKLQLLVNDGQRADIQATVRVIN